MRRLLVLACALVLPAVPGAAAEPVPSTVLLHDLMEAGAFRGCHVTTSYFTTYRLSVTAGDEVELRVEAPANNTNAHTLEIEDVAPATRVLRAGESATITFVATPAGSHGVLCDGRADDLSGLLVVRPAAKTPTKDAPAPAAALALAALAAIALTRARAAR